MLSVAAAIVGLVIGFLYAVAAAVIRRIRRQPPPAEIPLRFSLQKLFVAITLLAIFFGTIAFRLQQFKRAQKLVDRWSRSGVSLSFDYWERPHSAWTVPNSALDDVSLAELSDLTSLRPPESVRNPGHQRRRVSPETFHTLEISQPRRTADNRLLGFAAFLHARTSIRRSLRYEGDPVCRRGLCRPMPRGDCARAAAGNKISAWIEA